MNQIKQHLNTNKGFIRSNELRNQGNYYKARRALAQGELIKVRHGVYVDPDYLVNNMVDVETIIPHGIVCMHSAWSYYGLTTTVSPAVCVAINANRKVVVPDIIPFDIYYWKEEYLILGIIENEYSGYLVKMTDLERSVCDALRYRNKIGIELCTEILINYLKRDDRNLTRLIGYAKELRVSRVLSNYLNLYLQ